MSSSVWQSAFSSEIPIPMSATKFTPSPTALPPGDIQVSKSSSDLIAWAIGKFGAGALLPGCAVYIYSDLKGAKDTMDYQRETTSKLIAALRRMLVLPRSKPRQSRSLRDVEENTKVLRALTPRQ